MNAPVPSRVVRGDSFDLDPLLMLREAPPLARRDAVARPSSFNAEQRTIEAVIATGAPVQRQDERGAYLEVLDIAGADLEALRGASVLNAHDAFAGLSAVIGNIVEVWREGEQLVARMQLSSRPELEGLVRDIGAGVIASVSVGYEVSEWADGETGGQRTRTARKWRPREVSFVPVPADPAARTRSHPPSPASNRAAVNRQIRALAARAGVVSTLIDDLIDREASLDDARNVLFDNLLSRGAAAIRSAPPVTTDDPAVFVRAAGEGLYCRVAPNHAPSGPARQYLSMPLPELARECLRRAGVTTQGLWGDSLITRALHTTSDFPAILADTVGRTLRDAYQAAPSGIRQLGRQTTAPDFRMRMRLMLDSTGFALEKVNEHGEFRSGTMVEAAESYRLDTFGRIFGITRQALVNDDLGAFTDLTRRLGQAAAAFEAQFLVDLVEANGGAGPRMSDGNTLFHIEHGNLAGDAGAPSEDSLSAARLAMRSQVGVQGGLISVTPRFVLVPSALETSVEKLLSTIQATRTADVNVFTFLTAIVEPRLRSPTRWYVVAAPAEIDGLEYAYLAGQPGPQIDSQTGFRIDGVEMKVRLDYGAGFVDWRGWYASEGA
jgi:Caudovirus prohead serine protease